MNKKTFFAITLLFTLTNCSFAQDETTQGANKGRDDFIAAVNNQAITNNPALSTNDINKLIAQLDANGVKTISNDLNKAAVDTSLCDKYLNSPFPNVAAVGAFCRSSLYALNGDNGSTATISSNMHKGLYEIAKYFSYSMTVIAANAIYVYNDIFSSSNKDSAVYFDKLKDRQTAIDTSINNELTQVIKWADEPDQALTKDKTSIGRTLATNLQKLPNIDVNQFISVPAYNADQKTYATGLKQLFEILSLPPKKITIERHAKDSSGSEKVFDLKNYKYIPAMSYQFPATNDKEYANFASKVATDPDIQAALQNYNLKRVFSLTARSVNLNTLLRSYFMRTEDNNSLSQKEFEMASQGLSEDYYNKMAAAPTATINLEMLRSINRLVYFMYQIRLDYERLLVLQSVNGLELSTASSGILDDLQYDNVAKKIYNAYCSLHSGAPECPDDGRPVV